MEENLKQQPTTTIKIALFRPESTGKTTLARQLSEHFETGWVPEFARDYLQEKWNRMQKICEPEDLLPIAIGQTKLENETLLTANKYIFCDTNLLVTKVFSEMYYDFCDPALDKAARKHKYDLFFLTDIDVPWEKDDLRDSPDNRKIAFETFRNALIENEKPFITLSGNADERFQKALQILENLEKAKEIGFSSHDFVQIYEHGIPIENIQKQLDIFKKGIAKAVLVRPAIKDDGILRLNEQEFYDHAEYFDKQKSDLKIKKFVPASGAASRMFKFLNEFVNEFNIDEETINAYINRKHASSLSVFLVGLEKFPFYEAIDLELKKKYSNFRSWNKDLRDFYFIKMLLSSKHFDFANKPKGILPFHKYPAHIATPLEEHLNEGGFYASSNNVSHIHFTISKEHQNGFENIIHEVRNKVETQSGTKININFSYQDENYRYDCR
ncbi:DUF4301 family protein [Flavobacterium sp. 3HN19-14]|uniref:DUF4301 family protein n=1 Tax=Flavobacterium sp. 3HN19-14 TaxID=3448133 RepID=UPI003EDFB7B9